MQTQVIKMNKPEIQQKEFLSANKNEKLSSTSESNSDNENSDNIEMKPNVKAIKDLSNPNTANILTQPENILKLVPHVSAEDFSCVVRKLREFFDKKGWLEVYA